MKKRGFTLIEIMVSISIFLIVMTISMGSILGIFDANRKLSSLKTVMNNLNLAVESMSREIRFGKNYHCGGGLVTNPQNCASGDTSISFLSSDAHQITYQINGTTIEKQIDNGGFIAVTAPEITIESLTFYVLGALNTDTLQPKTLIKIKAKAGAQQKTVTEFTLQTLVSQRQLDL